MFQQILIEPYADVRVRPSSVDPVRPHLHLSTVVHLHGVRPAPPPEVQHLFKSTLACATGSDPLCQVFALCLFRKKESKETNY